MKKDNKNLPLFKIEIIIKFIIFMFHEDLNFLKAINILNSRSIKYWYNGTALGLVRDKKLIP